MGIEARVTTGFADFIFQNHISLLLSSHSNGQVIAVGCDQSGFVYDSYACPKPMGFARQGDDLLIAVDRSLKRFSSVMSKEVAATQVADSSFTSATYLASSTVYVGEIDCHEIVFASSRLVVAATKLNCLAAVDQVGQLSCLWKPSFVDELVYEDRCHLNGVILDPLNEAEFIVSCHGQCNKAKGWLDVDIAQGCLLHSRHGFLLRENIVMPHSPRMWHEKIVFCNSGCGSLDVFDPASLSHRAIAALPGFTRGLAVLGDYAIVAFSKARERFFTKNLPVFRADGRDLKCGLAVIDLLDGKIVHALEFIGGIDELFDLQIMPGSAPVKLVGLSYQVDTQVKDWDDIIRCEIVSCN